MKKNKFWNKISDSEIYIYGDIVETEINLATYEVKNVAKKFAEDLNSCAENVTIRINSNGGDCFTALAISNLISQSTKNISVSIDGICASAATLISCAAKKVSMAENALMMVHLPMTFLCDFYNAIDLAKVESSLNKVRDSILTTYHNKTGQEISLLTKLMNEETFLTAQEAKDLNFVDEISDKVEIEVDDANKLLIFNSLNLKKNYYAKAKEKLKMQNKNLSLIDKIKNILLANDDETSDADEKISDAEEKNTETEIENKIRAAEISRIKNLNSERCGIDAVNALIDIAIAEGKNVSDISNYISAIKKLPPPENKVRDEILKLIEDNLTSGAENVSGSSGDFEIENKKSKISAEMISKFANKGV